MFKTLFAAIVAGVASAQTCGDLPVPTRSFYPPESEMAFSPEHITGLWFEHVWSEGFQDNLAYDCSMWTFLKDTSERDMIVFNHMHFPEEDKEGDFKHFRINWDQSAADFSFTRHVPVLEGQADSRNFHIVAADYAYFMIAATCSNEGTPHWDYAVFTRDKGPSKFMR